MVWIRYRIFLWTTVVLLSLSMPPQAGAQSESDRVEALYLYNLLLFVDWPGDRNRDGNQIRLGIMGDPGLFEVVASMDRKRIRGGELIVLELEADKDLSQPLHALFIGASLRHRASRILDELRGRPVLTVSDMSGFADLGGMVSINSLDRQMDDQDLPPKRFTVNLKAAGEAGLRIRSRLLRLSDIVDNAAAPPRGGR